MSAQPVQIISTLLKAELRAGIFGLKLFIACVSVAAFMMGTVWILGDGLSKTLQRGGIVFLGGDLALTTTNVPLETDMENRLKDLGKLSKILELRTTATFEGKRQAVELKAVDQVYPLYGSVQLQSKRAVQDVLQTPNSIIVEPTFLSQSGAKLGSSITIGDSDFIITDVLDVEPDRLSAGRFLVGPRILMNMNNIQASNVIQTGSIIDYRYRLKKFDKDHPLDDLLGEIETLNPNTPWEVETPKDAGDRILRTVDRATTFLGMAGIAALLIGLSGAWASAQSWGRRRTRTIALYRLSGTSPQMVLSLHALIIAIASLIGLFIGISGGILSAWPLLDIVTARLHVIFEANQLIEQVLQISAIIIIGLIGTSILALSGVQKISPSAAMRSGDAPLKTNPQHVAIGIGFIALTLVIATLSLPISSLAGLAMVGLSFAIFTLAFVAAAVARIISKQKPKGFMATILHQSLSRSGYTATRTIAIGIGIIGITSIFAAQHALQLSLKQEIPEKVPDLVLIDIQPDQVEDIKSLIESKDQLGALQFDPLMRMTITAVNGVPAREALVNEDKSWVIEGDRSFSWTAEPTGAELLSGEWWPEDYNGAPLISPEEDVMEAFDLKVGDMMTYNVLGRSFTSEVVNIRKEYHRTFRPEYLMVASPEPFKNAPHSWIMSFQGETDEVIDQFITDLSQSHPNVTSIDVRLIVERIGGVISATTLATLSIAGILTFVGALSLAALAAADVDSRRKEALIFTMIGASRKEIAMARLIESATLGLIAALIGGIAGLSGAYFIVTAGLNVEWTTSMIIIMTPIFLGIVASLMAGIVGGLGAAPSGPGQLVRQLAS